MSFDASRTAWKIQGITMAEKIVLLSLADRADEDGYAWPSKMELAQDTCANPKTIYAALTRLEEKGLIRRVGYKHQRTCYQIMGLKNAPKEYA